MLFNRAQLDAAHTVVGRTMRPTPQWCWPLLCEAIGTEVWLKHENHAPTGAFKVRGGLVHLDRLAQEEIRPAGVVSATTGNHGQSLALAAGCHGMKATIVVPQHNNPEKNAAMRALGARLVVGGPDFDAARNTARALAECDGLRMVPPFHPGLVLGVATYALEFLDEVRDLDAVYVPVGMGSGIAGLITVRDLLGLRTRIVGVVASGARAMADSFAAGALRQHSSVDTFAEGVACREPDPDAFAIILSGADDVVAVSDDEIAEAMRLLLRTTHNLPEPAAAAPVAALTRDASRWRGCRVGAVHTGGNVDVATLSSVLAGPFDIPALMTNRA